MENNDKSIRTVTVSVKQWYELSSAGLSAPVTIKLDGESMRPLIRKQKDSVTIEHLNRQLKKGDVVLFMRNDGVYVVHRVYKINGEKIATIGDNCVEFDTPVSASSVMGIAVRLERNGKTFNMDSRLFRLYGILRMSTRPVRFFLFKLLRLSVKIFKRTVGKYGQS